MPDRYVAFILAMAFAVLAGPSPSIAADYPQRPVRMIVPFAPGGFTDVVARLAGRHLNADWGYPVIIDNRPGAAGTIGAGLAIRSNPDGHSLLLGSNSTFTVNPAVYSRLPYDVAKDLKVLGLVAISPHVVLVRSAFPAKSLQELVAVAKRQPGKFTFASSGAGAVIHMAGELLRRQAGIDLVHVPFKGGGPAAVAMLAGEVDIMVNDAGPVLGHLRSGRLRVLAVADRKRSPLLPDVPTCEEAGVPGVISSSWAGLAAPSATPPAVLAAIAASVVRLGDNREYRESLTGLGMDFPTMNAAQVSEFVRQELSKWTDVAKRANVRLEIR